ncbi:hypothetical protein KDK_60020 [Dictyobacter kobayashii]|uniref:Lantibiotic biosynthesis protein dehydration domain-containing protein n=1 Tax=Dictyobacter kobayashii TaxID=2014872 RepID=A0A402ASZ4_9CHLR|nr:type 2 lanthipeptide synthetase LanM family protein [Dictyobacter kobayashii]GCE22202.1 hypothetical protein KDK_60020 [Dictyobacter kobayashii]
MSKESLIQNALDMHVKDTSWYQATTLRERLHGFENGKRVSISERNEDLARGEWRLRHLMEQFSEREDLFAQRLAQDSLTEEDLLVLFSETPERVRNYFASRPAWVEQILQVFSSLSVDSVLDQELSADAARYQEILRQSGWNSREFLTLATPFIREGCQRLQAGVKDLCLQKANIPFECTNVEEYFLPHLLPRILQAVCRTLALELNIARLSNILQGETPEARFQNFIEHLQEPVFALALLQEYPVLTRLILLYVNQWVENSLMFLHRLCSDWYAICSTFSPHAHPGILKEVSGGAGDSHQNGQTVMILTFTSGLHLVYKPRSLNVDIHFQELLLWLNEHGDHPSFRTLRVLNQGNYGWVEFVMMQGCSSQEEVRRFYIRQGAYLAVLYVLAATDVHHENLIAAGEYPVLIDLESLFHPQIKEHVVEKNANTLAGDVVSNSVMRVMLLPQRFFTNGDSDGVEMSGLGGAPGQLSPHQALHMEDPRKDTLHFIRKQAEMPGSRNRPQLNGEDVDVRDYVDEIIQGFENMYRTLLQYRQELLCDDGCLAHFANDEVRAILRPTYRYARLLMESLHPDVLRNGLDRDILFDHLWKDVSLNPSLAKVIPFEQADLQRGDIPFFTTRVNSSDGWNSVGEVFPDFFGRSGLDRSRKCLLNLSEQDLEKQLWFIRASLTTLSIGGQNLVWPKYSLADTTFPATSDQLLAEACAVGNRLEAQALSGERDTNWIGLSFVSDRLWMMTPMGIDLYNGLGGSFSSLLTWGR